MKKHLRAIATGAFLLIFIVGAALFNPAGPTQAQQGIRGPVTGLTWIPSAFQLMFGDITTTDVYLQKNGANVLGISGAIGGIGTAVNGTNTPLGPYNWGTVQLAAGTVTVTFAKPFTGVPACWVTDITNAAATTASITARNATTLSIIGTGTDTIAWLCLGNPN